MQILVLGSKETMEITGGITSTYCGLNARKYC